MLTSDELLQILDEWNFWGKDQDSGVRREAYLDKLYGHAKDAKEIADIAGVRRSGKSTIMKQLIKEIISSGLEREKTLYVNFDEEQFSSELSIDLLRKIYDVYTKRINTSDEGYIFLDEIQHIIGWEKWLVSLYEKHAGKIKIFVSGSSSRLLSSEFSTLLSGRHLTFIVTPLSFREFLSFRGVEPRRRGNLVLESKRIRQLLYEYLENGGFPEAVLREGDKTHLLKQYFNDIIFRDIVERYEVRETGLVKNIALRSASRIA